MIPALDDQVHGLLITQSLMDIHSIELGEIISHHAVCLGYIYYSL